MAISKRLRYEILRRDNHTCRYCGGTAPDVTLTVDHVVPTALGGSDDPANLTAACRDCNSGKSATPPGAPLVAAVDEKAALFATAMNQVIEQRATKHADDGKILRWFDKAWCDWTAPPVARDSDWQTSVLRFHASGVSLEFMGRAVDTAMGNQRIGAHKVWRYFCGICWNEVKAIQDQAGAVVARKSPSRSAVSDQMPIEGFHGCAISIADEHIANLLEAVGAHPDVSRIASRSLWDGMQAAWTAFHGPPNGPGDPEDRTAIAFSDATAHSISQVQKISAADSRAERTAAELIVGVLMSAYIHEGESCDPLAFVQDYLRFKASNPDTWIGMDPNAVERIFAEARGLLREVFADDAPADLLAKVMI